MDFQAKPDSSKDESPKRLVADGPAMPQVDSETQVLAFLAEHPIPLKPIEVYGGLLATRTISFQYRTVQNKLRDLAAAGYLQRVAIDTDAGEIQPLDSAADRRGAYLITDAGRDEIDNRL